MKKLDQYDEAIVATGFDVVAARYGEVPFLRRTAEVLVESVRDGSFQSALDVATGPGTTALMLAGRAPEATVAAVDISPEMIATARARVATLGVRNVDAQVASATDLPFRNAQFDLVVCSSAIYYMADFAAAISEWKRVLRPGGRLVFSTFASGVLEPMSHLFDARVRAHGIVVPQPTPLYRLTTAEECRALLSAAQLTDVRTQQHQLGYWLPDVDHWWTTMMATGFRLLVESLDRSERVAFEREHKAELEPHMSERGLWVDVPAIIASGRAAA